MVLSLQSGAILPLQMKRAQRNDVLKGAPGKSQTKETIVW